MHIHTLRRALARESRPWTSENSYLYRLSYYIEVRTRVCHHEDSFAYPRQVELLGKMW